MTKADFGILVVDDEHVVVDFMSSFLLEEGYDCRTSSSAEAALEAIKTDPPKLVISDVRMPGMSGVELTEALANLDPDILVILVTAYAEYDAISAAIKLRPFAYIEKPFDLDQMRETVDRAFATVQERIEGQLQRESLESAVTDKTRELEFRTERLLAEKEMLHGIISNANFGLLAVDTNNTVHLVNPYTTELLGRGCAAASGMVGASMGDALPEQLRSQFIALFEQVASGHSTGEKEFSITLSIGRRRLDVIAYPIRYREQITAVVFIIHDVTEKEDLQQRLLQSAKLASIGELAAGVAHEINNPLAFVTSNCNALVGYLDSLQQYLGLVENNTGPTAVTEARKSLDIDYILEDAKPMMSETLDGLARVSKIVRDLKAFARVEDDTPQVAQVNALIDDALNLVRNETKYKLEVIRQFGELPELTCFPNQLVQVFTNLFINATHATKDKGSLTIATEAVDHVIRICITDTGSGIPEEILPRIFDPFFTTKEPGKGTGMGLSISFGIIQKHGGTLVVQSEVGMGTSFTIELPIKGCSPAAKTNPPVKL
ncbi:MAG: response regulator [bacterium]